MGAGGGCRRRGHRPLGAVRAVAAGLCLLAACASDAADRPDCDPDDAGLELPDGFCALRVAEDAGPVRALVVAANGDVFVALKSAEGGGGALALRDVDGDGRAERRQRFGRGDAHGIALHAGHLYLAVHDAVVRWPLAAGAWPEGEPETIVTGFPDQRAHRAKSLALAPDGALFVGVGAPSNACQREPRTPGSLGIDPCPQRERQAGIWRYAATPGQQHAVEARFATGLRHTLALAIHPASGALFGVVNGRDQLGQLWGFSAERNATLPAEEMVRIARGDDFGWPYCYQDGIVDRKVLAPEYGGDGEEIGRCADAKRPALVFPAHWAPMALHFYRGDGPHAFPARYRGGAFVAFRGSWNRAPLPQEGYRVAFAPFAGDAPAGAVETFAIGAEGPTALRMTGVAEGPDGSLYVAAENRGSVWRVLPSAQPAE